MKKYDLVIIGAGPAGCILCKELEQKKKILLIDGVKFPRNKPCGGILVKESQNLLISFCILSCELSTLFFA